MFRNSCPVHCICIDKKFNFQLLEQNNFALSEFVQNKKAESNYEPIKNKVSGVENQ
jgi:hypothetical protein